MNLSSCHICHCCSTQLVGKSTNNDLAPHPALPRPCILGIPAPPSIKTYFKTKCNRRCCSLCLLDGTIVYTPR